MCLKRILSFCSFQAANGWAMAVTLVRGWSYPPCDPKFILAIVSTDYHGYCRTVVPSRADKLHCWLSEYQPWSEEKNLQRLTSWLQASLMRGYYIHLYTSINTVYEFVWYPPSTSDWQDYNLFVKEIRFNQPSLGGFIALKHKKTFHLSNSLARSKADPKHQPPTRGRRGTNVLKKSELLRQLSDESICSNHTCSIWPILTEESWHLPNHWSFYGAFVKSFWKKKTKLCSKQLPSLKLTVRPWK